MVTDPIADMLSSIKNGYLARHQAVTVPYSQIKEKIAKILVKGGYLKQMKKEDGSGKKKLICELSYRAGKPTLIEAKRISKPGRKIYASWKKIPWSLSGYGITVVSTPKGLMTGKEARKKKLGGEIICQVY